MPTISVYVDDTTLEDLRNLREDRKMAYGQIIKAGVKLLKATGFGEDEVARV